MAGVAVADGELLARRCSCMQERGQVQCVRLLETWVKGGAGWMILLGWRSRGAEAGVLLGCSACGVVLFLLSQIEFSSALSFSLL